jgi:hypothetical protein
MNVTHVINENTWETRLKAQLRPAYNLMGKWWKHILIILEDYILI